MTEHEENDLMAELDNMIQYDEDEELLDEV